MSNNTRASPFDAEQWVADAGQRLPSAPGDGAALRDLSALCGEVIQALREESDFGAALCDSADTLIVVLDAEGRIVRFNGACERLTQYAAAEVEGRHPWDLFLLPDEAGAVRTLFADLHAGRFPNTRQNHWRRRDGALRLIAWAHTALLHPDGAVRHVVAQGVDITPRAEAEAALRESEARYQRIAANIPGMVYQFVLRPDGTTSFTFVSEGCRDLFGVSPDDVCADPGLIRDVVPPEDRAELQRSMVVSAQTLQPWRWEGRVVMASGAEKWLEAASRPARRPGGDVVWDGILMDVTERKRTEAALRESQELLQSVVDGITDPIFAKDLAGRYRLINTAGAQALGRPVPEIIGRDDTELLPDDVARRTQGNDRRVLDGGVRQTYEDADFIGGSPRTYLSTKGVYRDADGNPAGVFGIARDITKRRQAEDAVRERERQLQTLADNVPLLIARLDRDCRYLFANRAYFDWLHVPLERVLGRPMWEVIGGDAYAAVRPYIDRALAGERLEYDARLRYPTIGERFMHVSYVPEHGADGAVTGFVLSATDVTELRRTEGALRERTEVLASVLSAIPHQVFWKDRDSVYLGCNAPFARAAGLASPEQIVGRCDTDLAWTAEEAAAYRRDDLRVMESGRPILDLEEAYLHADGPRSVGLTSKIPLHDAAGRVVGVLGVSQDITERKDAEEALRTSRQALQTLFDSSPLVISVLDREGNVVGWNPAAERILGWTAAEVLGRPYPGVAPQARPYFLASRQRVLEGEMIHGLETKVLTRAGTLIDVSLSAAPLRDSDGQITRTMAMMQDITERKRAEMDLRRSLSIVEAQQEAAIDGILVVDEAQRIASYNQRFREMWRIPDVLAESGDQDPFLEHVVRQMQDPDEFLSRVQYLYEHPQENSRDELHLADGRIFDRYSAPVAAADGCCYGRVWYFRDITERKLWEAERERLLAEAIERADRDPLTGLLNHRAFHKRLEEEADRAHRQGQPLCVAVLDLDNFKFFNDAYGHRAGDDVLRQVADALRGACRSYDTLARFGGDEFAVLMPGLSCAEAGAAAERLRERLARTGYRPAGETGVLPVGASVGMAVFPEEAPTRLDVLELADARLRRAKTGGGSDDDLIERLETHLKGSIEGYAMLSGLVAAVDNKDRYTRRHSEDVLSYSLQIARQLGLDEAAQHGLSVAALLHDVGKIGVPDHILRKPGRLTDEEVAAMQQHPMMGAVIVAAVPGFEYALDAVRHHHERWDGGGYPFGLRGTEIPLAARLMAVADAFSAMTTDRPYRQGMPEARALALLAEGAGSQWDPACVQAFLAARRTPVTAACQN